MLDWSIAGLQVARWTEQMEEGGMGMRGLTGMWQRPKLKACDLVGEGSLVSLSPAWMGLRRMIFRGLESGFGGGDLDRDCMVCVPRASVVILGG